MLIDSHAHLDAPYFQDKLAAVLYRANQAGVEKVITIGVTPGSSRRCLDIARKRRSVFATAGYHPHWARKFIPEHLDELEQLARDPKVVAIGEIGLDYHHFRSPKEDQRRVFVSMLDLASSTKLPVVIHDRKANKEVSSILSGYRHKLSGVIIHCFSGDWSLARTFLDWGFYLSIPGPVTYPQSSHLREVAVKAPLDRILLETDAPHLTPAPKKGHRNEPAFVRYTANEVAGLRKVSLEEVARATTQNTLDIFGIQPFVS